MRTNPKYLPSHERRAATVQTVVTLTAKQNPSEITTTEIARHMGLTQGSLFKHFPSKDAILQAVMEWVAESLMARVDGAVKGASSPLAALEALFLAHVDFVAAHPGVPRIVFGELQRAKPSATRQMVQTLMQRYSALVARILADAKAQGELDPAVDVEAASILFVGTIQGLVMQSLLLGNVERIRRDAPRVFVIFRRGIGSAR